jgi:hypothetical protein
METNNQASVDMPTTIAKDSSRPCVCGDGSAEQRTPYPSPRLPGSHPARRLLDFSHIAAAIFLCVGPAAFACSKRKAPNIEVSRSSQFEPARLNAHNEPRPPRVAAKISEEDAEAPRVATRLDAIQAAEVFDDSKSLIVLAHALSDPSSEVKEAALEALTEKNGTDVTQAIRRGLEDADPEFRMEALEALAEHGDLESLRIAKLDPSDEVRERAAELLESAGH